jgi:hypothetical protein
VKHGVSGGWIVAFVKTIGLSTSPTKRVVKNLADLLFRQGYKNVFVAVVVRESM